MEILNDISEFFRSYGIDPLVGGFICGIIVCALARTGTVDVKPQAGNATGPGRAVRQKPSLFRESMLGGSSLKIRINVNGEEKELDDAESAKIMSALKQGNKIEAIKQARESTGLDLKEAKDLVEALEKSNSR